MSTYINPEGEPVTKNTRNEGDMANGSEPVVNRGTAIGRRTVLQGGALVGGFAALGGLPLAGLGSKGPTLSSSKERAADRPHASRGGILNIGVPQDVQGFNPNDNTFANYIYSRNFYDGLIDYTSDLAPIPQLATSWEMNRGNLSLRIHLRPGAVFQDGTAVSSQAIAENFKFASNTVTGFSNISIAALVKQVRVLNPTTLILDFVGPTPLEMATDILQSLPIISPKALNANYLKSRADGSGPFDFSSWTPGSQLVMSRNARYWDRSLPYLDGVVFHVFTDSESMVAALSAGEVQAANAVPASLISSVPKDHKILKGPQSLTYNFHLNAAKPPFNDPRVRQAMMLCVDREAIVRDVLFGHSEVATLPWSPSSRAYDSSANSRYAFNLAKAKALFDAAGVQNETWTATCPSPSTYPSLVLMAEVLKASLSKIGITLNIVTLAVSEWVDKFFAGEFQVLPSFDGYVGKYPTFVTLNSGFRLKDNVCWGPGAPPAAWTRFVREAEQALTPARQRAAFAAMNNVLLDDAWIICVAYREALFAAAPSVSGVIYSVDDVLELKEARLS